MKLFSLALTCVLAVFLVYISKKTTTSKYANIEIKAISWQIVLAATLLILFAGLRTEFNDTLGYIRNFKNYPNLSEFFTYIAGKNFTDDLGFTLYSMLFRSFSNNANLYIMVTSGFIIISYIHFIRQNVEAEYCAYALFFFIAFDYYVFCMGAMKQSMAMAIIAFAVSAFRSGKKVKFFLLVLLASFVHFFAIFCLIIPILYRKAWSKVTFITIAVLGTAFFLIDTILPSFLSTASEMGLYVAEGEVLNGEGLNIWRILVYAVLPVIAFIRRKAIDEYMDDFDNLCINLGVLSMMFMLLGFKNGANMFGRMVYYFNFIAILVFPKIIHRPFNSYQLVKLASIILFSAFFIYDNIGFNDNFYSMSLSQFVSTII